MFTRLKTVSDVNAPGGKSEVSKKSSFRAFNCSFRIRKNGLRILLIWPKSGVTWTSPCKELEGNQNIRKYWKEIKISGSVTPWRGSQGFIIWKPPFLKVDPVRVYRSGVGPYLTSFGSPWPWRWPWLWEKLPSCITYRHLLKYLLPSRSDGKNVDGRTSSLVL